MTAPVLTDRLSDGRVRRIPMRAEWLTDALATRFWSRTRPASNGCIEWAASRDRNGYGQFSIGPREDRHTLKAHRVAWFLRTGADIPEMTLDHLCRNRACVNPDHLEPVSQRINSLRGQTTNARNAAVTHCPQGHPYDAENTRFRSTGARICRACRIARDRKRYAAIKERRA